jgi:phosphopantothenate-cysteine ligase
LTTESNTLTHPAPIEQPPRAPSVLVTGGGTIAPIDDVRVIANVSTGRFASQISQALLETGAAVWHVATPAAATPKPSSPGALHLRPLPRGTVAEYAQEIQSILTSQRIDIAILAAAVSDFEPVPAPGKIDSDRDELVIRCRPAPKIIEQVKRWAPRVFLVGFKMLSGATDEALIAAARRSITRTGADLVVANDLRVVHTPEHRVFLVDAGGHVETIGPGVHIARALVAHVLNAARSRAPRS